MFYVTFLAFRCHVLFVWGENSKPIYILVNYVNATYCSAYSEVASKDWCTTHILFDMHKNICVTRDIKYVIVIPFTIGPKTFKVYFITYQKNKESGWRVLQSVKKCSELKELWKQFKRRVKKIIQKIVKLFGKESCFFFLNFFEKELSKNPQKIEVHKFQSKQITPILATVIWIHPSLQRSINYF